MERESTVRRLQGDLDVYQANGKPFTTEKSAELFKRNWSLEDTHEVRKSDVAGFILCRLPEACRPSAIQAQQDRLAADPEYQLQERLFKVSEVPGGDAARAATEYEAGDSDLDAFAARVAATGDQLGLFG
ncbi:hypothetical protein IIE18_10665 [Pseudomonas sp. V1]|uniref:hypothetical protein n=1 Tax=Pseudomonas arcuscaelestis TaxID=2710591 RepID=UPI00193F5098|nr:hypothetical protein [Pseudomonas arcuscaelestis]MBM3105602.1 hypothetical protein [Pseudomonas arcuscaelestis]